MKQVLEHHEDLRLAAIAPAIVGHAVVLALFFSIAPLLSKSSDPVEVVQFEDSSVSVEFVSEAEFQALSDQQLAGNISSRDPRLGTPEGGLIERAAVPEDLPFLALGGVDAAETQLPSATATPQEAALAGNLGEGGDRLTSVRLALRRQACRRLTAFRDPTCPREDPFVLKARYAALREAEPLAPVRAYLSGPQNVVEAYLAANATPVIPVAQGLDQTPFVNAARPGSYAALQLRDGVAPQWLADYRAELSNQTTLE